MLKEKLMLRNRDPNVHKLKIKICASSSFDTGLSVSFYQFVYQGHNLKHENAVISEFRDGVSNKQL